MARKTKYMDVFEQLPTTMLVESQAGDEWRVHGVYDKDDFSREDNNILVNGMNGSPLWLRVTSVDGDVFTCETDSTPDYPAQTYLLRITATES